MRGAWGRDPSRHLLTTPLFSEAHGLVRNDLGWRAWQPEEVPGLLCVFHLLYVA